MLTQNDTAHGIIVFGSLKIHSVKITSWDPKLNDYIKFKVQVRPNSEDNLGHDEIPRPYIRIEQEATGTTDVIDSEIAYMGYKCDTGDGGGCAGLNFYGGHGSIVKNNHIHNNRFGFYSDGVGNMILENNHVHHNYMYGFDPHTGTHDMIIRNNTIHNNGGIGIICSLDCYKITIEGNHVYENIVAGIMFSRNMTNSIAINNISYNETQCIFISQSHNNKIYNNTVSHCENGIYLKSKSSNNIVSNNSISDSKRGIYLNSGAKNNTFNLNQITNVEEKFINLKH
jgi:parallel beta-helix repeat protein